MAMLTHSRSRPPCGVAASIGVTRVKKSHDTKTTPITSDQVDAEAVAEILPRRFAGAQNGLDQGEARAHARGEQQTHREAADHAERRHERGAEARKKRVE